MAVLVEYRDYPFSRFHVSLIAIVILVDINILLCCWFHFFFFLSWFPGLYWSWREKEAFDRHYSTSLLSVLHPKAWKQCQKVLLSYKSQLNGNYVSLIYSFAKVYGNIKLNWAWCKQILKVRNNLSRLLNLWHPVGKSKYGACAVIGLCSVNTTNEGNNSCCYIV